MPDDSIRRTRNCARWSANSIQLATADPSGISSTSTRPSDPASSSRIGGPNVRPASLENATNASRLIAWSCEPGNGHVASPRAQHRTVHWTRGNLPRVGVHGFGLRPFSVLQARDDDVAHVVLAAIAIRNDWTFRGDRCGRRTTFADAQINWYLGRLLPVPPERREPHAHRTCVSPMRGVRSTRLHRATIEPCEPQAGVRHLEERRKSVLGPGRIRVRRERRGPRFAVIFRVRRAERRRRRCRARSSAANARQARRLRAARQTARPPS